MKDYGTPVNTLSTSFPGLSENEAVARGIAASFVSVLDPTVEELGEIRTAVSEAVSNGIIHAYPNSGGTIHMCLSIYPDRVLTIEVEDQGVGIEDIARARKPMFTTGGEYRSGMGFTIMESFMTELEVESIPGKGTVVRMVKQLKGEEA